MLGGDSNISQRRVKYFLNAAFALLDWVDPFNMEGILQPTNMKGVLFRLIFLYLLGRLTAYLGLKFLAYIGA